MDFIQTSNKQVDKFGPGKHGFSAGNPTLGVLATFFSNTWADGVQQEIINAIEAAGLVPTGADLSQLVKAIKLLATGRRLRTTRYSRVAGVQNISVDGGANTTTGAGTFTRHADTRFAIVKCQAGGSGGTGALGATGGNISLGAPGCAGSYGESIYDAATLTAGALTVTVGLGSAGSSAAVGGTSSFGLLMSVPGGTSAGGTVSNLPPPSLVGNGVLATAPTGANLVSIRGGAPHLTMGLSSAVGNAGAGGASVFGPGGNGATINTNGTNAVNPGSGGSGTIVNAGGGTATGGDGAAGIIIVEEYA